jgi:hypothetical protein
MVSVLKQVSKTEHVETCRKSSFWLFSLELVVLICLAVFGLEFFFKLTKVGEQEFLQPDSVFGAVHIPNKIVTWRMEGYSHDRLSPQGLRDVPHSKNKTQGVTRVVLLGDSATEGMQVPLESTYGRVLERQLNVSADQAKSKKRFEVINFGCSGYSTGQQVLQYEQQIRQYHPDIVILMYNRGDNVENVFVPGPAGSIPPRPYFKIDCDGKIATDMSVMQMNEEKLRPNQLLSFLRCNSRIFGVFSQQNLMLSINEPFYRKLGRFFSKLEMSRSPIKTNKFVKPSYPLQDPWLVTTKLFERLRKDVKDDGADFILLLFPNGIQDTEYQAQERAFAKLSEGERFHLISLSPVFSKVPDMRSLFLQYHLSRQGHFVVASLVRDYFVEKMRLF